MPQQNMQELAHALFQYIKEVCQLTQKEIFDVDKQRAWVLLSQLDDPACVKLYSRDTVDDETVNNDGKLFSFRKYARHQMRRSSVGCSRVGRIIGNSPSTRNLYYRRRKKQLNLKVKCQRKSKKKMRGNWRRSRNFSRMIRRA